MSIESRQNALKNFLHFDGETQPLTKVSSINGQTSSIQLESTSAIIVIGYITQNTTRFAINLVCRGTGNIAFHFNPRLDRGYIVRNSKIKGSWDEEETCSPAGFSANRLSLHRNTYFHLVIFCSPKEFYVSVNGQHFCTFAYRLPLQSITNLEYDGDIEDVRYRSKTLCIYPDPKIISVRSNNLELSSRQPHITKNLGVPATVSLFDEFRHGTKIFIKGRLKLLPHSFYVNLQNSPLLFPHPDIYLHLNPRFQYGHQVPSVVMNCWGNGSWGREERHEGLALSWGPGREFLLTIKYEYDNYIICLGNKIIGEFKNRINPNTNNFDVNTLHITGDIVLYELVLSNGDN